MYSNCENAFAQMFAVLALVQCISLITGLSIIVLILTAEDVKAKETKERKQVAANK